MRQLGVHGLRGSCGLAGRGWWRPHLLVGGARGGGGGGGNGSWVARDSGSQAGRAPVGWHGAQLAGDVGGAGRGRSLRMKMKSRVLVGGTVEAWVGEGHHSCGLEEQKGGYRWSCVWMMMMRRSKVRTRTAHSWSHKEDLLESGPWHLQHLTECEHTQPG